MPCIYTEKSTAMNLLARLPHGVGALRPPLTVSDCGETIGASPGRRQRGSRAARCSSGRGWWGRRSWALPGFSSATTATRAYPVRSLLSGRRRGSRRPTTPISTMPRVALYLGQLEGGIAKSEQLTQQLTQGRSAGVSAGGLSLGGSPGSSSQAERVVTPTATARFYQLLDLLGRDGYLHTIERRRQAERDRACVSGIPEGSFVKLKDCTAASPELRAAGSNSSRAFEGDPSRAARAENRRPPGGCRRLPSSRIEPLDEIVPCTPVGGTTQRHPMPGLGSFRPRPLGSNCGPSAVRSGHLRTRLSGRTRASRSRPATGRSTTGHAASTCSSRSGSRDLSSEQSLLAGPVTVVGQARPRRAQTAAGVRRRRVARHLRRTW